MEEHGMHPGLELRLKALSERNAALRQRMRNAKGAEDWLRRLGERYASCLRDFAESLSEVAGRESPGLEMPTSCRAIYRTRKDVPAGAPRPV